MYHYGRRGGNSQPTIFGGFMGLFAIGFAVFWTYTAYKSGAPIFFCLFGVLFVFIGIYTTIYNFKNANKKEKSKTDDFDIYDEFETEQSQLNKNGGNYCPYCGAVIQRDYEFCNICGKRLP